MNKYNLNQTSFFGPDKAIIFLDKPCILCGSFEQVLKDFLFFSKYTHRQLSSRDFQRIVKQLSIRSIGRPITPHILRHTFATRLLKHTNLRVTQVLLEHSNLQTTQLYTHVNIDDALDSINKVSVPG